MSKIKDGFEEVPVSRRAGRSLADEDALKLDDSHELHPTKKTDDDRRRSSRDNRNKKNKKKKSGNGKIVIGLLAAIVLVVALVIGAKMFLDQGSKPVAPTEPQTEAAPTETPEAENHITLTKDSSADILNLVKGYYDARVAQDTDTMAAALMEGVEINTQEVSREAEIMEAYQDVVTYVTDGMQEGENLVYVTYGMKFKNIDTAAPGMVPVYVIPDSTGAQRLMFANDFTPEIRSFVSEASHSKEVDELTKQIEDAFAQAQENDADLNAFIQALMGQTPEEPEASSEDGSEAAEPAETEAPAEAESTETTAAPAPTTPINFTETDDIQYATTQVKCRKEPSTDGDEYTIVEAGEWVHVIGTSEEWFKVITQDHEYGYIKAEYLSVDKPETSVE